MSLSISGCAPFVLLGPGVVGQNVAIDALPSSRHRSVWPAARCSRLGVALEAIC